MKKFFTQYDVLHKFLAVLLAIMLWFFVVVSNEDMVRTETYSDIPITFLNEDVLEQEYNLKIIEGSEQTLNVKVSGSYETMVKFDPEGIQISTDISAIRKPGTYTIDTAENCKLNVHNKNVQEQEIAFPASFQIVVDRITTKEIPISVQVMGSPQKGYMYGDSELSHESVTITGPESVVNTVKKAVAVIPVEDSSNLTKSTTLLASVTFLDEENNLVEQTHLNSTPAEFYVTIPVYAVARLPLTVTLIDSETLMKDSVSVNIEPSEISVYGQEEVISKLTEINMGQIQLGSVDFDEPKTVPIQLPDGVKRVNGEPAAAKVTIKAVGMSTREIPVTHIELKNTGINPDVQVSLKTTSITVKIQAETAALTSLTADSIKVIAEFNADTLTPGLHAIPVDIKPVGLSGFTILNPDQTVTIEIY